MIAMAHAGTVWAARSSWTQNNNQAINHMHVASSRPKTRQVTVTSLAGKVPTASARQTSLCPSHHVSMQGMLNCRPLCKAKSTFVTMECKRPLMESSNKTIMPLPNSSPLVCFATAPNNHGHPSSPSGSSGLSAAHFFCARYHLDLLRRLLAHPYRQQG